MLTERASAVIREIGELDRLGDDTDQLDKSRTRLNGLTGPLGKLKLLLNTCAIFSSQGISPAFDTVYIAALKTQLSLLRVKFDQDRYSILNPDPEMKVKFWDRLKELPSEVETSLLGQWKEWIENLCPKLNFEVLAVLEKTPLGSQVNLIMAAYGEMNTLSQRLPESAGDFENAREIGKSLTDRWNNLEGEGIPVEVLELLKGAASDRGAPISSLTRLAVGWLSSRNILNTIRLKIL